MLRSLQPSMLALAALLEACSYHVLSPPARTLPLETPATLAPSQSGVAAEGGAARGTFGPTVIVGTVRYRRGLVDDLDGSVEVNMLHVPGGEDVSTFREAFALHAGTKYRVWPALALLAGIGGGGSAAGGFVSPDLGLSLGYENRYVVPFLSARGFVSQPFAARDIDLGIADGERKHGKPKTTLGATFGLGVRIPIEHEGAMAHSLAFGVSVTAISDRQEGYGLVGGTGNFEGVF